MAIPDPNRRYPIDGVERTVFLKTVVNNPLIEVGDYTYYDDPDDPEGFEKNVLYHFPFVGDRLVIGKFCQIASRATFIMNGANHSMGGLTTYPFAAFGGDWAGRAEGELEGENKGDLVIGNDVWIGFEAMIMAGVTIGDGAIIAARSVVTKDVEPYSIVAGNPAVEIRKRFDEATVERLLELKWWDWPVERVNEVVPQLVQGNLEGL